MKAMVGKADARIRIDDHLILPFDLLCDTPCVLHASAVNLPAVNPPMPEPPPKSIMRSLGEFFGHIAKGITTDPTKPTAHEVKRSVEETRRDDGVILRRTVIEEVQLPADAPPPSARPAADSPAETKDDSSHAAH